MRTADTWLHRRAAALTGSSTTDASSTSVSTGFRDYSSVRAASYAAAALSLIAATAHAVVIPEHFAEWWGYGMFFVLIALSQGIYAAILVLRPRRVLLLAGIAGNLVLVATWALSRTAGIPFFGPHAWEPEPVGAMDLSAKVAELLLIAVLVTLLGRESWGARVRSKVAVGLAAVLLLLPLAVAPSGHVAGHAASDVPSVEVATADEPAEGGSHCHE